MVFKRFVMHFSRLLKHSSIFFIAISSTWLSNHAVEGDNFRSVTLSYYGIVSIMEPALRFPSSASGPPLAKFSQVRKGVVNRQFFCNNHNTHETDGLVTAPASMRER
jgi:hypothetical protein